MICTRLTQIYRISILLNIVFCFGGKLMNIGGSITPKTPRTF